MIKRAHLFRYGYQSPNVRSMLLIYPMHSLECCIRHLSNAILHGPWILGCMVITCRVLITDISYADFDMLAPKAGNPWPQWSIKILRMQKGLNQYDVSRLRYAEGVGPPWAHYMHVTVTNLPRLNLGVFPYSPYGEFLQVTELLWQQQRHIESRQMRSFVAANSIHSDTLRITGVTGFGCR